ncbi:PTS fructose transporter subunit IIABC [Microaceticoccus formicicus]|uniref:PTS fructose transporter subunit IIABC n=1 Tax=Microaceticoccus formicicus TaxID=3118105 RepID=UPI003CD0376C|nr:fructose-specific PTS transporter subunit EIIC [Peptoniphilaceae bacterium AMB_02]
MKITDLISRESIKLNASCLDKADAIHQVVDLMMKSGRISDREVFEKRVFAREEEGTTGVGEGVAIPHGKSEAVIKPGIAAMTVPEGVDYESLDGEPTKLIFLIAAPAEDSNVHLEMLSKLSMMLMDSNFIESLVAAKSVDEFLQIINDAQAEKDGDNEEIIPEEVKSESPRLKLLAVTGCPTGIAHTYMAQEALEKKARELGYDIKVETRGSGGAKNVLTAEDIREADGIIVASDTAVPMSRFNGKKVIETKVSDGISKPGELIEKVLSESTKTYRASETETVETRDSEGIGHKIYKDLMSGVSHMLPFVVGGGILIALAFLIDGFSVDMNALPEDLRGNFGSITPIAAMIKDIGGTAFSFMLPILAGFIALSIADRPGLAVGFVGGAIAAAGKSGFLGALVAGFLAGYIVKFLMKATESLPKSLDGIRPILIYPLLGILLIGLSMFYIIEPIVGVINTGLNNWLNGLQGVSSVILGMILGGMMSIDMGGPFNKAAYVFGTASIAAGNYNIMAAVMIGGMVPPTAIALATLLFKNKFTETERKSGPVNFIMGLSFITEGAIPFAAADPFRVIPACIAGSALAGGLSMLFNCTLMAPHGGIFVFPVVGNGLMYLVSLVAGTVLGAVLLGILKRNPQI